MTATAVAVVVLMVLAGINLATAHNITAILEKYPEYSKFNGYLSQTKVADEINSRNTITVLVLNNAAISALADKHPLSVVKNAISLCVLLDYFDAAKLHDISDGTTLSTTLYQTTGKVPGNLGFVNITDLKGGKVGFGSAAPGSPLASTFVKSVKQEAYNVSVLEISAPIIAPGLLTAPAPSAGDLNLTAALEKAGCKTFAGLLVSNGVLKMYQAAMDKGLTVFAPNDEAFKAAGVPDLSKLTNAEVVALLLYHAVPGYNPAGTLKTSGGKPFSTLASNGAAKYELRASAAGDDVTLHTGVSSSRVASSVVDITPVVIFTCDDLLLPPELFATTPSPAPAPAPVSDASPTPSPAATPSTTPSAAPAPVEPSSPPAPALPSPDVPPTAGPASDVTSSPSSAPSLYGRAAAAAGLWLLAVVANGLF